MRNKNNNMKRLLLIVFMLAAQVSMTGKPKITPVELFSNFKFYNYQNLDLRLLSWGFNKGAPVKVNDYIVNSYHSEFTENSFESFFNRYNPSKDVLQFDYNISNVTKDVYLEYVEYVTKMGWIFTKQIPFDDKIMDAYEYDNTLPIRLHDKDFYILLSYNENNFRIVLWHYSK